MTIHHVNTATGETWTSRAAPLSGTDSTALTQAMRLMANEAARLHDEGARAGAGPEVLREAEACAAAAGTIRRLLDRRSTVRGPGGVR